jgi:catechol 2,3-dioxygenase-like lactoylglutathione lyase family enzyme
MATAHVQHVSAVTFAVRDMARAVAFYRKLGFEVSYGGPAAAFTTVYAGNAFVNLALDPDYRGGRWGRVIFRVNDARAYHAALAAAGLGPGEPRDGEWGERYFHVTDPDGHELSFAQRLFVRPGT